jgi:hypothetical protein
VDLEFVEERDCKIGEVLFDLFFGEVEESILKLTPGFIVKAMQVGWFHEEKDELVGEVVDKTHEGLILVHNLQVVRVNVGKGAKSVLVDNGFSGERGVVKADRVIGRALIFGQSLHKDEGLLDVPGFGVGVGVAGEVGYE